MKGRTALFRFDAFIANKLSMGGDQSRLRSENTWVKNHNYVKNHNDVKTERQAVPLGVLLSLPC